MLRSRFALLATASVCSGLGNGFVAAAFPLLAASLTTSPIAVVGVTVAAYVSSPVDPSSPFHVVTSLLVDHDRSAPAAWARRDGLLAVSLPPARREASTAGCPRHAVGSALIVASSRFRQGSRGDPLGESRG